MAAQTQTQSSWLRGLNLATGRLTVVPGSLLRNSNVLYTKRGSVLTVDGTKRYTRTTEVVASPTTNLLGATRGPAGMFPMKVTFTPATGAISAEDLTTNPSTVFSSGLFPHVTANKTYRIPAVFNAASIVIFCIGNDGIPFGVDFYGNTVVPLTATGTGNSLAGAAHGIFHNNFIWLWNTAQQTNYPDGPSSLRMSDSTLVNFPILNQTFVDRDDGTQGQGMVTFTSAEAGIAPPETLVLFKDFSFSITRAQTDMGCVAPRSIQFAPGFGIIRMTHYGIAVFDGIKDTLISEEIRPYLFQSELDVQPIDWSRITQCQATVTVNPPMYVIAIPLAPTTQATSGALQRILCYDLVLKAWTVIDLPGTGFGNANTSPLLISCVSTVKTPGFQPTTMVAPLGLDNNNRWNVMRWLSGDATWEGVPINWRARLPDVFAKNPTSRIYFRQCILRAKTSNAKVTANVDFGGVMKRKIEAGRFQYVLPVQSLYGAAYGLSLYGSAIYGQSSYGDAYPDLILPFSMNVTAFSANVEYTGTGKIELLANDWQFVLKPEGAFARAS
jgi:hypothetical protein